MPGFNENNVENAPKWTVSSNIAKVTGYDFQIRGTPRVSNDDFAHCSNGNSDLSTSYIAVNPNQSSYANIQSGHPSCPSAWRNTTNPLPQFIAFPKAFARVPSVVAQLDCNDSSITTSSGRIPECLCNTSSVNISSVSTTGFVITSLVMHDTDNVFYQATSDTNNQFYPKFWWVAHANP
jgi:hypothetical protein